MALVFCFLGNGRARAQENVRLSGLAYLDYYYILASPDTAREDLNGFQYRRLYLTGDYLISDAFRVRARLEASDASINPFVKDLYLQYQSKSGHAVFFGIVPAPGVDTGDEVWGYRSLEKTLSDRVGQNPSRDFGVRVHGPLTAGGAVRYVLMAGNNSAVRPETDRYKRIYGQVSARPGQPWLLALTGNYAAYGDERKNGTVVTAQAGYLKGVHRVGAEAVWSRMNYVGDVSGDLVGLSVFGALAVSEGWTIIGRADRVRSELGAAREYATYGIASLAYQPHPQVRLMPNVMVSKVDAVDRAEVAARFTVDIVF